MSNVLNELDNVRSILDVLATLLENNAAVRDYHSLACLAADGRGKCDALTDMVDKAA